MNSSPAERRELMIVVGVTIALIVLRTFVFIFYEQSYFDSDQAVWGLMAKHLSEGQALPLFMYGQHYMLGVDTWLAAPVFLVLGPSVAALKLPLLIINFAVAAILLGCLTRCGLRPAFAFLAAVFFVLAPPIASSQLVEAGGGSVEPFLYVLLLWLTRGRPVLFGAILAIGFLNREFTIYGLTSLLMIELANGSFFEAANLRHKLLALVSFALFWDLIGLVKLRADTLGPGTAGMWDPGPLSLHLGAVAERVGLDWNMLSEHSRIVFTENLPALLGVSAKLSDYSINSSLMVGLRWLVIVLVAALILGAVRLCYLGIRRRWLLEEPTCDFCFYLILVGVQSALVYTVLGRDVGPVLRYMLLSLFMPVGLAALYFKVERRGMLRAAMSGLILFWAAVSARDHVRLLEEYRHHPPPSHHRALADYLVANHIEHGRADYWDAYRISFLAREQVMLASTGKVRVERYQLLADEHRDTAVEVSRLPCRGGRKVSVWYLCPP